MATDPPGRRHRARRSGAALLVLAIAEGVSLYASAPSRNDAGAGPVELLHALTRDAVSAFSPVVQRLPATTALVAAAMLAATVIGIILGLYGGLRVSGMRGRVIRAGVLLGVSVPVFWLGLLLLPLLRRSRGAGMPFLLVDHWGGLVIPAAILALGPAALLARDTLWATRRVMRAAFVTLARAKGLSEMRLVGAHVLPNILPQVITAVAAASGSAIAMTLVVEVVFARPGIGSLLIDSTISRDGPLMLACAVVMMAMIVGLDLVSDVLRAAVVSPSRLPQPA